ncbi:MAG TPA: alpha/beta hydrolase [Longimicrobiales bacterium]|nr:alpha/beta hydrolase [Longimicrobiales bacterium]
MPPTPATRGLRPPTPPARSAAGPLAAATAAGALVLAAPAAAQGQDAAAAPSPLEEIEGVLAVRDVDYVPGEAYADGRDLLDVFMPEGRAGVPVVVFFHGGELRYGSKASGEALAARLLPMGIGVVSANYRLSPPFVHPAHVQDASTAVAWVLDHIAEYGGDPANVYVSGHSAGAYLAALMAVDERWLGERGVERSRIRGWIPISPFLYVEETARDRPKVVWGEDPADWLAASVAPYVGPDDGRWLIVYADGDADWRKAQNERFAAELHAAENHDVTIVQVPGRTHTSLMTAMGDPDDRIGELIRQFVGAPPTGHAH